MADRMQQLLESYLGRGTPRNSRQSSPHSGLAEDIEIVPSNDTTMTHAIEESTFQDRLPEGGLRLVVTDPVRAIDPFTGPVIGTEEPDHTPQQGPGSPCMLLDMMLKFLRLMVGTSTGTETDTETSMVEIGDGGTGDDNLRKVGDGTSILQGVTEALQVTVGTSLGTGLLIPGAPMLMSVAETLQVTTPRSPPTCLLVPRTSVLMCVAQQFQVTVSGSIVTCILVPRTTVLVGVTETLQVTGSRS